MGQPPLPPDSPESLRLAQPGTLVTGLLPDHLVPQDIFELFSRDFEARDKERAAALRKASSALYQSSPYIDGEATIPRIDRMNAQAVAAAPKLGVTLEKRVMLGGACFSAGQPPQP